MSPHSAGQCLPGLAREAARDVRGVRQCDTGNPPELGGGGPGGGGLSPGRAWSRKGGVWAAPTTTARSKAVRGGRDSPPGWGPDHAAVVPTVLLRKAASDSPPQGAPEEGRGAGADWRDSWTARHDTGGLGGTFPLGHNVTPRLSVSPRQASDSPERTSDWPGGSRAWAALAWLLEVGGSVQTPACWAPLRSGRPARARRRARERKRRPCGGRQGRVGPYQVSLTSRQRLSLL